MKTEIELQSQKNKITITIYKNSKITKTLPARNRPINLLRF